MLENILIRYFGLSENWNDESEKAQLYWNASYSKLIGLLYKLEELGVLSADKICDCLDIINESEE